MLRNFIKVPAIAAALLLSANFAADACSRVVFLGDSTTNNLVMVGRTLDWRSPIPTNIYVYPAGIAKQSMPNGPMLTWTSKYASTLAVSYDGGVTEGMNNQGLVMNGLFCTGSVYKMSTGPNDPTPVMSLAVIVSYFLDNFTTVDEVADWLATNDFDIFGKSFDNGTVTLIHWELTDRTGDSLLMEYHDGNLAVYHSRDIIVLTNNPAYPQMKAINEYWESVGGVNMLPGTVRSTDRFARASFFINNVPKNTEYMASWAALSSIMGTVSVPFGYEIKGEPNVSSTQWRSIADLTNNKYYFKFADSFSDFWVDMNSLQLTPGSPILKLDTADHAHMSGCINHLLKKTTGFNPIW